MINGQVYQEKKRARGLDSVWGGSENLYRKVNILPAADPISHGHVRAFSLVSDMNYVTQNAARIARALFADVRENAQVHQGYREADVGL